MTEPTIHRCSLHWSGDTVDYDSFARSHIVHFPRGQSVATSTYREPEEHPAKPTNPEELLAAALGSCLMLTFLAVASKSKINVLDYEDHPEALLELVDRRMRVTRITLRPVVTLSAQISPEHTEALFSKAHANCYISNSIQSAVEIHPTIKLA